MDNELMIELENRVKDLPNDIKEVEAILERPLIDKEVYSLCTKGKDYLLGNIFTSPEAIKLYKTLLDIIKKKVTTSYMRDVYNSVDGEIDIFHQGEYEDPETFSYQEDSEYKSQDQFISDLINAVNNVSDKLEEDNSEEDFERQSVVDDKVKRAYEKFVRKPEPQCTDKFVNDELTCSTPVPDSVLGKEVASDDLSTLGILNNIPEHAKKWMQRLTAKDLLKIIDELGSLTTEGKLNSKDETYSELVDKIKDMAIAKYTLDIISGRITDIEDEEIRSEVVDYMKHKHMEIPKALRKDDHPTICSKEVDKIINRLDKGCEIELDSEVLDAVVEKLWTTRNNVSIKIHNNKISLR